MSSINNVVVAVYDTHEQAEQTVRKLQESGFDMKKLSIVAKNPHAEEHVVGFYNAGDRIKHWGGAGAFWGVCGVSSSVRLSSLSRGSDQCSSGVR
jgi:hypothetical protein